MTEQSLSRALQEATAAPCREIREALDAVAASIQPVTDAIAVSEAHKRRMRELLRRLAP